MKPQVTVNFCNDCVVLKGLWPIIVPNKAHYYITNTIFPKETN